MPSKAAGRRLAAAATVWIEGAWPTRGARALALAPLAAVYALVTGARRWLYRSRWRRSHRLPVPVVVVGNLIVGGAGKTPTVIATVEVLRRLGWHPGIVSRGYGGRHAGVLEVTGTTPARECGDEPLLLHRRTGAPTVVGADRVAAARWLLGRHPTVDILVADDGLQHRALGRDVEIVVFDERGAGNGWLLPAGPLRETLPAVLPARTLVVYNAAAASTPLPGFATRAALRGVLPLADWRRDPRAEATGAGADSFAALRTRPIAVAAGLGRPGRFFAMLRAQGLEIAPLRLSDHHDFTALPWPATTAEVIVTEKDAVKLDPDAVGATRVWVAPLDFTIEARFDAALARLLPSPVR